MKSDIITKAMIEDHGKIMKLLIRLGKTIGQDKQKIMEVFNEFVWELEKHFFTEEKAVFTAYEPEDETEGYAMIPELIKEHKEIFDKLKEIKKRFKKNKIFDFQTFENLLKNHKNFEEKNLYPRLDEELDESEKKIIIQRINEIHLKDSI